MIDKIREANPELHIYEVLDPNFRKYGRILSNIDPSGMLSVLENRTEIPAQGNTYTASFAMLEEDPMIPVIRNKVFGGMEIQAGFCNGHSYQLNALEYHKCPEVNVTNTGAVLFLGSTDDIDGNNIHSSRVKAFYLPAGVVIELHPRVLHFAPCRIREEGFKCIVILGKGTNLPLEKLDTELSDEDKLLKARNKWMIAHPDFIKATGNNAFPGITGENLAINAIK
jgi:hypothetical protein